MTSPRVRPLLGGRVRPGLMAPVVVAIVLGVLGMHGIGAHGVSLHASVTHAEAAIPPAAIMADHDGVAVDHGAAHSAGNAAVGHLGAHAGGTGGMVMLCVAMLAGVVALLTLLVRRGRLPKVWAILDPPGRVAVAVPAVLRVGTGPPAVWRFSVIRC